MANFYKGSTNDLKRRLKEHNEGLVTSTTHRRPLELKSYIAVETEELARNLEKHLKSSSGGAFIHKRLLR